MAEGSDQERTEEPTQKRLEESKKKGQLARSRELNTAMVLVVAAIGILVFGGYIIDGLLLILEQGFKIDREHIFDINTTVDKLGALFKHALITLAPLMVLIIFAAFLPPIFIGGITFSPQAMAWKWNKMDPIKGTKRLFGAQGFMELVKALVKFLLIGSIAIFVIYYYANDFMALSAEPLKQALNHLGDFGSKAFLFIASAMLIIAAVDTPFQVWQHKKNLRMTRQETKEEHKQSEGSPEIKSKVRRLQIEMAQRRMMSDVPDADVIVTNPTHYAVALKYDQENMNAPVLVAKGSDLVAMKIRMIGNEHQVPILEIPPLARSLYYFTEIGDPIPKGLYIAVAKVLAYVFNLKRQGNESGHGTVPNWDFTIPTDLRRD